MKKGEMAFRKWFGRINEIRSIVGKVPLIALTATASTSTRLKIMWSLEMKSPALIMDSPNRDNISYAVQVITPDPAHTFKALVKELQEHKGLTERTIIYCQTIKVTSLLYSFFMSELGDDMYIDNSGDPKKRTVEMFHSRIDDLNRDHILESMGETNGSVRVLIATIAYGMGIDCKNVKTVLHYGPSYNLETYLQESGRAGRSNYEMCKSVVLYSSLMMKHCSEEIKSYVRESSSCRRKILLKNFDVDLEKLPLIEPVHNCCDFCKKNCKCQGDCCDFVFFKSNFPDGQEGPTVCFSRVVSDAQRGNLRQKLNYLKKAWREQYLRSVRLENVPMFTPAKLSGLFGDLHVEQIWNNCEKIFTVTDIFKFVDIWNFSVALEVLFTFSQVFHDVDVCEPVEDLEHSDTSEFADLDIFDFDVEDSVLAVVQDEMFYIAEDSRFAPNEEESGCDVE